MLRHAHTLASWILLAAIAVGGLAAPLAHRLAHASERVVALSHDTSDHHHDDAGSEHGPEAQPTCPEIADFDWTCTLCHGPTGSSCEADHFVPAPPDADVAFGSLVLRHGHDAETSAVARGPPSA